MKRIQILFTIPFFCTCFLYETGISQATLRQQLAGKSKLHEIMPIVDAYYADDPVPTSTEIEFESEYMHWKRWEWYMSGRLGPDGEFVNITQLLMEGLKEKERMRQPTEDRNINSSWTFVGPSSTPPVNSGATLNGLGRVNRVVFHPTDSNTYYLCTPNGGLWRTTNDGDLWTNLTDHLPCLGIADFVISYANTNIMYLLTGDPADGWDGFGYGQRSIGVLKSTDGGTSWFQTDTMPDTGDSFNGHNLEQSPTNPDLLIAATTAGNYRTTNGGNTWIKEEGGQWWDVKFKPGDGNRVYGTKDHAYFISTDSGDTWNSTSTFDISMTTCDTFGGDRVLIAVAPTNVSKVYLLSAPRIVPGQFCGVWLSNNSGASFTRQSNTPNIFGSSENGSDGTDQTNYDMAITCRSDLSSTIFAAGCTVWKSDNGGVSWDHTTSYSENGSNPYIHPDVHGLDYNPIDKCLYASTDGGVYKSEDNGETWENLSDNVETSQFYHMAGWDGNINKLLGGLQDNGIKYRKTNSSAFYHVNGADGFDVVFNPVNGFPKYATVNTSVYRYNNDGGTVGWLNTLENEQWFKTLAIHNTDSNTLIVGAGESIFRTVNAGATWTDEGATGSWSLTSCPSNNARFYASGGANFQEDNSGGLYFSANTGDTWTLKSGNSGFPSNTLWNKITDVTVSPLNSNYVYASFGGFTENVKVVMSTNTGDSWTNISFNLPNIPINCLAVDNNYGIYAGTDIGVFYKGSSMPEWMPWSNGLPNTPVSELVIFDDGTTKRIRAATYGRGVWQSNLPASCDPAVIVTGSLSGIRHYEASTSVSSSGTILGGIGTFVSFQSGNYITLSEGFNVIDDSEFLGYINPCGQGGIPSAQGDVTINRDDPASSIILLRRMWDPESELPYGNILDLSLTQGMATIRYDIRKPGKVEFIAARQVQEKLDVLYAGKQEAGSHVFTADVSVLTNEFHYLMLFYEGKLVHFQEMDLRP